jgi:pimeloyl-ACP methyl ester carboxylesterase
MVRRLTLTWLAIVLLALPAAAQSPAAGAWKGAIRIQGMDLQIAVTLTGGDTDLKGTIDIPQQGAKGLALTKVSVQGTKVHFELPAGPGVAVFDGEQAGDRITGTFDQAGMKGTFELARGAAAATPAEPPPPYKVEEVKVKGQGEVTLAGTLTLPQAGGPHPAVILITGSGPQNRDEEIFGFRPFRLIADHLTRNGIAVLRCDDRGVAASTGNFQAATTADFADDVQAQFTFLTSRADIRKDRIGLLGHSEGALVAPMVAARTPAVAFVVLLSGPAVNGERTLITQGELIGQAEGVPAELIQKNAALQKQMFTAVRTGKGWEEVTETARTAVRTGLERLPAEQRQAMGDPAAIVNRQVEQQLAAVKSPWFKFFLDYDPALTLQKVKQPVLALFGELDLQVAPAINREVMEATFKRSGHTDYQLQVVPRANHLYQVATTGAVSEYAKLPKEFAPSLLPGITSWIKQRVK